MTVRRVLAFVPLLSLLVFTMPPATALLAAEDLDPSFGVGGAVIEPLSRGNDEAIDVLVRDDGTIVVAVSINRNSYESRLAVLAYTADGQRLSTFGTGGMVEVTFPEPVYPGGMSLDGSGNIVLAGSTATSFDIALARLTPDGQPDTTFSGDGMVVKEFAGTHTEVGDVVALANGNILVAYYNDAGHAIARFFTGGGVDTGFGTQGVHLLEVGGAAMWPDEMALDPDGRLWVAGEASGFGILARLQDDGDLDTAFSDDGYTAITVNGYGGPLGAIDFLADGRIVTAGYLSNVSQGYVARWMPDGILDSTFSQQGVWLARCGGCPTSVGDVEVAGSKLLVAGDTHSGRVWRLLEDGSRDDSFSVGGVVDPLGWSVAALERQSNGMIVAAGSEYNARYTQTQLMTARLRPNGATTMPDAAGRRVEPCCGKWTGEDVRNGTGDGQVVRVSSQAGRSVTIRLRISQDGSSSDLVTMHGDGSGGGIAAAYGTDVGGASLTTQVVDGTLSRIVARGDPYELFLTLSIGRGVDPGTVRTLRFEVASAKLATQVDVLRVRIEVR